MRPATLALFFVMTMAVPVSGQEVVVIIENTMDPDSFFLTPFWIAAHNGDFDIWSSGQFAGQFPGLEELAEEGDTGPISAAFAASPAELLRAPRRCGGARATR